jgi:hypothetical protein
VNEDLDEAAYRILRERTGLSDVYLEQVQTFGATNRHPAGRVVTIAYCSLINIQHHKLNIFDNELHWHDVNSVTDLAFDHQQILTSVTNGSRNGSRNIRLDLTCCQRNSPYVNFRIYMKRYWVLKWTGGISEKSSLLWIFNRPG